MKTATYIKLDADVKTKAQALAQKFGLSLSTLINVQLKQAVRDQRLELNVELPPEQMTPALEKELGKINKDIKAGKNLVGPFATHEELAAHLRSL